MPTHQLRLVELGSDLVVYAAPRDRLGSVSEAPARRGFLDFPGVAMPAK